MVFAANPSNVKWLWNVHGLRLIDSRRGGSDEFVPFGTKGTIRFDGLDTNWVVATRIFFMFTPS